MEGWIKLHRNILNWHYVTSSDHLAVFTTLLLRANFKESKWRNVTLQPGQLITGRKQLSQWTGLSESRIRAVMRSLKESNEISQQTTSKFSIITILNWGKYQQDDQQIASKSPALNQHLTTSKNAKNAKKEKKHITAANTAFNPVTWLNPEKNLPAENSQENLKAENVGLFAVEAPSLEEEQNAPELAIKVLTALNTICFRAFRPKSGTLKPIKARINEGYSYKDFVTVIKHFQKQWGNSQKMSQFLAPSTLFNTKFEERLEQARSASRPLVDPLEKFLLESGITPDMWKGEPA